MTRCQDPSEETSINLTNISEQVYCILTSCSLDDMVDGLREVCDARIVGLDLFCQEVEEVELVVWWLCSS